MVGLYHLCTDGGSYCLAFSDSKNRMQLRNELHLREMEKSKLEELNHAKLQFFTNITHELLDSLTIISATVDELKMRFPGMTTFIQ